MPARKMVEYRLVGARERIEQGVAPGPDVRGVRDALGERGLEHLRVRELLVELDGKLNPGGVRSAQVWLTAALGCP